MRKTIIQTGLLPGFIAIVLLFQGCDQTVTPESERSGVKAAADTESWGEKMARVKSGAARELRHTSSPISTQQLAQLNDAGQDLTILEIDQSLISTDELHEVLSGLPKLNQLRLEGPVDNAQVEMLVSTLPDVKVLNLPHGTFDSSGLESLSGHQSLELLRFSSPHVDDADLAAIPRFSRLKFLHLMHVPITDQGLEHIVAAKKLQSFYLDGGTCTEEGLSKLIKARPNLHFHWNQLHLENDPHTHPHD